MDWLRRISNTSNPSQVVDYVATITRLSMQYFGADYSSAKIY